MWHNARTEWTIAAYFQHQLLAIVLFIHGTVVGLLLHLHHLFLSCPSVQSCYLAQLTHSLNSIQLSLSRIKIPTCYIQQESLGQSGEDSSHRTTYRHRQPIYVVASSHLTQIDFVSISFSLHNQCYSFPHNATSVAINPGHHHHHRSFLLKFEDKSAKHNISVETDYWATTTPNEHRPTHPPPTAPPLRNKIPCVFFIFLFGGTHMSSQLFLFLLGNNNFEALPIHADQKSKNLTDISIWSFADD